MFNIPIVPIRASEFADQYDWLFYIILALTFFFTFVVGAVTLFLVIRYRRGTKVDRSHPPHENLPLEITWSVIPLVLGLVIFALGARQFIYFKTPPNNALEVYCVGKQWMWHFQHAESGVRENNALHLPMGVPVKITMISQDVIHALFIPEFRFQYQVVPGEYTQAWITPTRIGTYHLFCNMYCGTQHSEMGGYVYVMSRADYAKWSQNGGSDPEPMTLVQRGKLVFDRLNCASCHTTRDDDRAPTLDGVYGKLIHYTDGSSMVVDSARLREAIINPYNHVVQGYGNTMPEYQGAISEMDLFPLMEYLKTLGQVQAAKKGSESSTNPMFIPTAVKQRKLAVGALGSGHAESSSPTKNNLSVGEVSSSNRAPGN